MGGGPREEQQIQVGGEGILAAIWDEVAIGLEIGVQPRVEIRCVKQTGCRLSLSIPRCTRGSHVYRQAHSPARPSPTAIPHLPSPLLLKSELSSAGVEVNNKTFPSWPFA